MTDNIASTTATPAAPGYERIDTMGKDAKDWANSIGCPVAPGTVVTLPAGTVVRTMHPSRNQYTLARAQKVTVNHTLNGYVDLWNDHKRGVGYVVLPSVRWPGTGGYWNTVKVTPELCEMWGVDVPAIPEFDEYDTGQLDAVPAYGVGYDNRDVA